MTKPLKFDFIVVYSNTNTYSATNKKYTGTSPFSKKGNYASCNSAYEYLLQYSRRVGLHAAFSTVDDISGTGEFSSYWIFNKVWKRVQHTAQTFVIFDKFSNLTNVNASAYKMLIGTHNRIVLYHNHKVRTLFDNKLTTHSKLNQYMLPTVSIKLDSKKTISKAKKALKIQINNHLHTNDFTHELILKDIFGGGGDHIYKIQTDARFKKIAADTADVQFLLQPFIHTSNFNTGKMNGLTDLRVIIGNNTMLQSYIRTAKKGDFRANIKQGGSIDYVPIHKIPQQVIDMIAQIQKSTDLKDALYTLDFICSQNGNLYLIEGNASPGLTWSNIEDEKRAKQLMRIIVKQLQMMSEKNL
ncbi:MAG TPA: hypothetical protein VJB65_04215 [Patescibacteria group bacterium]|nr:hypothetical protein [Patescibacteria group bacterium]